MAPTFGDISPWIIIILGHATSERMNRLIRRNDDREKKNKFHVIRENPFLVGVCGPEFQ